MRSAAACGARAGRARQKAAGFTGAQSRAYTRDMPARSIAVDAIKGALVILMVVYHSCYVAVMFGIARIELYEGFWWLFPRCIAAGFVLVSGWNLAAKRERGGGFADMAKRAGKLAAIATIISLATWFALGDGFVFFGIIHLLALSSLAVWPLLGRPVLAAATGAACLAAGLAIGGARFGFPWLAWLGLRPSGLYPADYLPMLPWFAFAAFGAAAYDLRARIAAGRRVGEAGGEASASRGGAARAAADREGADREGAGARRPEARADLVRAAVKPVAAIGKRSLAVYLIHLPLLYAIGLLISRIRA